MAWRCSNYCSLALIGLKPQLVWTLMPTVAPPAALASSPLPL